MTKSPAVLTKLSLGLPFNLGNAEFVTDETQVRAAWSLYVELITRIAVQPLRQDEGLYREALNSLYSLQRSKSLQLQKSESVLPRNPAGRECSTQFIIRHA